VAFLGEANMARNQHLMLFQGNVEKWAADHQQKVDALEQGCRKDQVRMARLEKQLATAQAEIRRVAVTVPLSRTPPTHPSVTPAPTPANPGSTIPGFQLPGPVTGGNGGNRGMLPKKPRQPAVSPTPSPAPSENDGEDDGDDLYVQNLPTGRPPPV